MRLGELIGPDRVLVGLRAASKMQLLQELARRAGTALLQDPRVIFDALQAREDLGSTGLGKGFALPHARLDTIAAPFALFARLAKPIDFAAVDEKPVDLVALLLTPANASAEHLSTLAAISRPMRNDACLQGLRQAPDAHSVREVLVTA